ncbi:hypothetical protein COU54_05255 [Candidatus Pacearchaeota archaeon CG10_big_fil_rev_8_21_14_0_10_31_24]|nr:MAG: hypothetical protein COU54_05255 [Candidatus Pacearchaeota archaeon CG10_big_fil_rev_8_21_14_0_10_31_24]
MPNRDKSRNKNNRVKGFRVNLESDVFDRLYLLYETELYGRTVDETAEQIFCRWVKSHRPSDKVKRAKLIEKAQELGYYPGNSSRRRPVLVNYNQVYVRLGGIPRYVAEHLPKAEPMSGKLKNPYYQLSTKLFIERVIIEQLPIHLREMSDIFGE